MQILLTLIISTRCLIPTLVGCACIDLRPPTVFIIERFFHFRDFSHWQFNIILPLHSTASIIDLVLDILGELGRYPEIGGLIKVISVAARPISNSSILHGVIPWSILRCQSLISWFLCAVYYDLTLLIHKSNLTGVSELVFSVVPQVFNFIRYRPALVTVIF